MHREIPSSTFVRQRSTSKLQRLSKKYPLLCVGVPFLLAVVGGTFVLLPMQETKYEIRDRRSGSISTIKEHQALKKSKPFNIQEEYFKMQTKGTWGEWEPKRVERAEKDEPVWDRQ
ncbi:Cytochrome oxidase assembly [Coemansia sp. RSA 1822]|nr:Cytochrome oxidase assembly [Coemansia sp. RSA 2131]KAJ2544143.1 Cytochrome oxidase assembly [Coemansia sp. RSA 1853]KAJ2567404.1 Cytochrome oxidase assembly [Coemansia sp. RSA 1822]KAJ2665048.1 Cytochrome oxidase assembly [Coemansia sp. RSA 1199]